MKELLYDIFIAYYDARRNKRNTIDQLGFEVDYESYLIGLWDDLCNGDYKIGKSKCFLICDTVPREIFAASFRDRIVHHLIYNYIYNICDTKFVYDNYSCRVGKGTHFGIRRIDHFIRSCSDNYTKTAWILKLDIKGFFMNINKDILTYRLRQIISYRRDDISPMGRDRLRGLIKQIIYHDPVQDYIFCGSRELYKQLPDDKSLSFCKSGYGIPIGNLTSQLFANVYMQLFDIWMNETVGCKYYGRYVDDFIIVHRDKSYLIDLIPQIRSFLYDQLGLTLHPKKIYLQHFTKGVKFLGGFIMPHRIYVDKRTVSCARQRFLSYVDGFDIGPSILSSINSYLGSLQHGRSFHIRKKLAHILPDYISFDHLYTKAKLDDSHRNSSNLQS